MHKILIITFCLFHILGLFTTGAFAFAGCGDICCCATTRSDSHPGYQSVGNLTRDCCAGAQAHPCGGEISQGLKLPDCNLISVSTNNTNSNSLLAIITRPIAGDNRINGLNPFHLNWIFARSSPLYLQNLTLQI